ncbi:MAG: DNA alkylation repair protein [Chitinophagales bacterium]|nr:DNA alkylation repair protein [Chitinophagales bacterium]
MAKEKFLLKDHLFNPTKVTQLAKEISSVYPDFPKEKFIKACISEFPKLELKARIDFMVSQLRLSLPHDISLAIQLIIQALPQPLDPNQTDNDFGDFIYAPYAEFIAAYACDSLNLRLALNALKETTKRFSAENAIRFFINAYPDQTYKTLYDWSKDENYHVRRLCSEGTRPKLPWSAKINTPIEMALPILEALHADKTRYVTRSVANHLNDLSKIYKDLVISLLKSWHVAKLQTKSELDFITKHASRTLIKQGNEDALALIGIQPTQVNIHRFDLPEEVPMNSKLIFSLELSVPNSTDLLIDYIVHFPSVKRPSQKTFKLKTLFVEANKKIIIEKSHMFRDDRSTKKLSKGLYIIEIQINGNIYTSKKVKIT